MKCPLCSYPNTQLIDVNHAFFRHYDFATIKEVACISRCSKCQLLFNPVRESAITEIDDFFKSQIYSLSEQTSQTLIVDEYEKPVTRSFLQAELLVDLLPSTQPSILDIGCFDGALLTEFDGRLKSAHLHGFDVNEYLVSFFPKKDNFHFWSSDIAHIEGEFDLICMSHSIQYIKDVSYLIRHIKRLLKNSGFLFVQASNILRNPHSILLGEQYYYYTPSILMNMFHFSGFEFSLIDNNWFPREIVGVAKHTSHSGYVEYINDSQIELCLQRINNVASRLRELSSTSRLGVLGTTLNAAFVDSILGMKLAFFADENLKRVGGKFRNKNVLHPESLRDSDLVLIPYGESSQQIKERFENQYRGRFMCL